MALSPSNKSNAQQVLQTQQLLLESLVAIATKHINEQVLDVSARMVAALLDLSEPGIDARAVYQRVKSGNLLKENSYAFVHVATGELDKSLRRELELLLPSSVKARAPVAELSLVPFEEMDNRVAFDVISRPFELLYAAQIATVNLRLGLALERDVLRLSQNPFRPELFLSAIQEAWHAFEPDAQGHALIQPLLRPEVIFDLAPMYDALVATLIASGGRGGATSALNARKTDTVAAAKSARARQKAELSRQLRQFLDDDPDAGPDGGIPLIPDLPASVNSGTGGGWRPSGAQGFAAPLPSARGASGVSSANTATTAAAADAVSPAMHAPVVHGFVPGPGVHGAVPGGGQLHGGSHTGGRTVHDSASSDGVIAHAGGHFLGTGPGQDRGQGGTPFFNAGRVQGAPASGDGALHGGQAAAGEQAGFAHAGQPGEFQQGGNVMVAHAPLLDMLRSLQARSPGQFSGMARGSGGMASADVFYLPRLKESMPKGSLTRRDESTIDLLSKVFDTVFLDPNIPTEIRELIHFLQIPVLKAALADKNFFFEEAHPARRMIDLMSRIGMEQRKGPDDPLFQAMQRSVDRIGREPDDQASGFSEALAELEASVKADDTEAETEIAAPIAAALKQEKHTAATRSARHAVAARVGSGEVVALLETFLENRWTSVLTVAYTVEDDKPGAVNNATKTMDDLIWSVKPKISQEQRKSLIAKLPGLLATLNRWLDVIKWQDADRVKFFADLAECHASIVRAPLDISPERQLEIAVEVAQQDALRRLEKEQAAAAEAAANAPLPLDIDDAALAVESLERSQWFEFTQPDGSVRKVKLAWISPLRTLFIFSTGARQEAFSVPVEKLLTAFREDKVRLLRLDGLVGRALSEALAQGAGNDACAAEAA